VQSSDLLAKPAPARLRDLPGLGPKAEEMLLRVGIDSPDALRRLGSVRAFVRCRQRDPGASLNLLWALEGALSGEHWQVIARRDRTSLLLAVEEMSRIA